MLKCSANFSNYIFNNRLNHSLDFRIITNVPGALQIFIFTSDICSRPILYCFLFVKKTKCLFIIIVLFLAVEFRQF